MSVKRIIDAMQRPKKVVRAINYKVLATFGTSDFRPFIVLTRARTGSNLLISLLDSHPNIRAEGELFRELNPRFYRLALNMVFSKQPRHIKASGFKIFYGHTSSDGSGGIWGHLERMDGLCVIHLKRKNILRALVSTKIAKAHGTWVATPTGTQRDTNKAVSFTAEELEEGFRRTRRREERGARKFEGHSLVTVCYEDLVDDVQAVFRQLTEFLGVPFCIPRTSMKRQNPEPLRDLIANYDELRTQFLGTVWQQFFDD